MDEKNINPAKTAHIDGLLKRKGEAEKYLRGQYVEYHDRLRTETTARAIDREHFKGQLEAQLDWICDSRQEQFEEEVKRKEAMNEEHAHEIQRLIREGVDPLLQENIQVKDARIAGLVMDSAKAWSLYHQLNNRLKETADGFCHVLDHREIYDWTSEAMTNRLVIAERLNVELQQKLNERGGHLISHLDRLDIPLTQGQGMEYGREFYTKLPGDTWDEECRSLAG